MPSISDSICEQKNSFLEFGGYIGHHFSHTSTRDSHVSFTFGCIQQCDFPLPAWFFVCNGSFCNQLPRLPLDRVLETHTQKPKGEIYTMMHWNSILQNYF